LYLPPPVNVNDKKPIIPPSSRVFGKVAFLYEYCESGVAGLAKVN
jgi:hypothetical protein